MSEQNASAPPPSAGQVKQELFSERKKEFLEDLECLYIKGNQSGRLMYARKWPDIAERLFPKELTRIDHEGLQNEEERETKEALEIEAELKHDDMLSIFADMEQKLVVYGSLQLPALEAIMNKIDRTLAEYIFAERFVNKYFPGGGSSFMAPSQNEVKAAPPQAPEPDAQVSPQGAETPQQGDVPTTPVTAEQVEEPKLESDIVAESIGHVDHSYNTKIPDYDAKPKVDTNGDGVIDEKDSPASWLDEPEDEFGDVMPISTEEQSPQTLSEGDKPPPTMGLNAHKKTEGSDLSNQEQQDLDQSIEHEAGEDAKLEDIPDPANVHEDQIVNNDGDFKQPQNLSSDPTVQTTSGGAPQIQQPPKESLPPTSSVPGGDTPVTGSGAPASRKPLLPGQEAPASASPPPPTHSEPETPSDAPMSTPTPPSSADAAMPSSAPTPEGGRKPPLPEQEDGMRRPPLPPSAPPAAPENQSPESKPIFGDMPPPPQSTQGDAPATPRPAESGSATDAPRVPPLPGQSSNAPPQGGTQPDEKGLRKPSLDDLPPLPGSDDGSDY